MSYILDALRRADAERQRGAVPGLHDQAGATAAPGATATPAAAGADRAPWPWAVGGLVLAAALGGAWWLGRGAAPQAAAPVSVPAVATAPMPTAVPAPPPTPVPVQIQVQVTPAPAPPAAVALVPPVPQRPPAVGGAAGLPVPAATPANEASPARPAAVPPAPGVPSAASPATSPATSPVADADPIRAWSSLPESARAALPPLAWSGAVHAERAEQRLVIVNGQVAREGDMLANGLQLLQIRPKSVLLRWQGQRIEMPI